MASDAEKELAIKSQLGRLVNQKINTYMSLQEAAEDTSTSLMVVKYIDKEEWDKITIGQLWFIAERFGIQIIMKGIDDEEVQHS